MNTNAVHVTPKTHCREPVSVLTLGIHTVHTQLHTCTAAFDLMAPRKHQNSRHTMQTLFIWPFPLN